MNDAQREALLGLAHNVVVSDGLLDPNEEGMLDDFKREMELHPATDTDYLELGGIEATFDSRKARLIAILNLLRLSYADGAFEIEEECLLKQISRTFGISDEEFQGFGYPAGGLSAHAAASGGAFAEFDYASTRNPSALMGWGRGGMYLSYAPEFRAIRAGGTTEKTTTARFPGAVAAFQIGSRAVGALSWSTLLDRTWETSVRDQQVLGPDTVGYTERVRSTGAINDLRLGFTYSLTQNVTVGVGLHGYTGENRMQLLRQFDDSFRFGTLARQPTLGYLGNGFSVGATWRLGQYLAVAGSARAGGTLDLRLADTLLGRAG